MPRLNLKTRSATCEIILRAGSFVRAGAMIKKYARTRKVCVVSSPNVMRHWGRAMELSMRAAELRPVFISVDDAEAQKNMVNVEGILARLAEAGADRETLLVSFGGGVVSDMAGMAASIYQRGIDVVHVPTTLLAQVDAAIGGKTGVNLASGKNLAGTFHQPRAVIVDSNLLATLPQRVYRAGLYECLKCGIIKDKQLFELFERNAPALLEREPDVLASVVERAVKVKTDVVARDERDHGSRRILNFGHTIGHALEAAGDYRSLLHGEAVGIGMLAAVKVSELKKLLKPADAARINKAIAMLGPLPAVRMDADALLPYIAADKKSTGGIPKFVLLSGIGRVSSKTSTVLSNEIRAAIEWLRLHPTLASHGSLE